MTLPPERDFNLVGKTPWGVCAYNRHDVLIGTCIREHGEFSEDELCTLRQVAKVGSTVLDVGANIGALAVPLAMHVGRSGAVIAFEPQRLLFQLLCANAALNSVTNLYPVRAAVGDAERSIAIPGFDPEQPSTPGKISLDTLGGKGAETVAMMPLDALDLVNVSLIKIDVEGMELQVLQGARNVIGKFRPVLYVENDRDDKSAALIDTLRGLDYTLFWDLPRLVRDGPDSVVRQLRSMNMLCCPAELAQDIYLEPVAGNDDTPQAAMDRFIAKHKT